jgi:hypothetical protein
MRGRTQGSGRGETCWAPSRVRPKLGRPGLPVEDARPAPPCAPGRPDPRSPRRRAVGARQPPLRCQLRRASVSTSPSLHMMPGPPGRKNRPGGPDIDHANKTAHYRPTMSATPYTAGYEAGKAFPGDRAALEAGRRSAPLPTGVGRPAHGRRVPRTAESVPSDAKAAAGTPNSGSRTQRAPASPSAPLRPWRRPHHGPS